MTNPLKQAIKDLEEEEELALMKAINSTLAQTTESRSQILKQLRSDSSHLRSQLTHAQSTLEHRQLQLQELEYTSKMEELKVRRSQVERRLANCRDVICMQEDRIDELLVESRRLVDDSNEPVLDRIGLKLKIYRSLGFDVQRDQTTGEIAKCRIRGSQGDDVQTVAVNSDMADDYHVTRQLWNLCGSNSTILGGLVN